MTSPAQGLYKQTTFGKQTALGTPKTGAGGQILRRKTAVFSATRNTTTNDEIVSHRQDTGITYGQKNSTGKVDGNYSPDTYADFVAAALMADYAAVSAYNSGTDTAAAVVSGNTGTFTDTSAGYLTAGLKVGMVGRWTGFSSANNARNFWITALTSSVMTGLMLDGLPVVADAGGVSDDATFTPVGKFSKVPLTGHTDDWFTFEEWYPDAARSEVFPDCKINQINVGIPAEGPATMSLDIVGLGTRTLAGSQSFSSPTAETTTDVAQALRGAIYVNGTLVEHVTTLSLMIDRGLTPAGASIGSSVSPNMNVGRVKVTGSFVAMFDSAVLSALFDAETAVSMAVVSLCDSTATSKFIGFTMGKIKLTGDAPDDGEKVILRTYPFTAEINGAGGTSLAWDKTILTSQDSDA